MKFIPRKNIMEARFYSSETQILEIPVYLCMSSKALKNMPPRKLIVTSILTEANGLTISCNDEYFKNSVINMGECTTAETVYTTISLSNNSRVFQIFGFVDLPESIQISPNYGFGEIQPFETKTLTLSYSPEPRDIPKYETADTSISCKLRVESVKSLGGIDEIKSKFTYKLIRRATEMMRRELENLEPKPLMNDIENLVKLVKSEISPGDEPSVGDTFLESRHYPSMVMEEANVQSNQISVTALIVEPLCDLSHQCIIFPDTPCGSYSLMAIELRAHSSIESIKCVCSYGKKYLKCKKHTDFEASFQITGESPEISVEPCCGHIRAGEKIKLTLVAKPKVPRELVLDTAKELQVRRLLQNKLEQWYLQQKKGEKILEPPKFEIDDEIVVDEQDLYQAEMQISRVINPFPSKANFCCTISYSSKDFVRNPETLHFEALCKVVNPSFVHNLNNPHIDFGTVLVGMHSRKIISLQNISDESIRPIITPLSPTGFFTIPNLGVDLPSELILNLPLTFRPEQAKKVIEYFEIRAGGTIYPLVVSGEGIPPNFIISPEFCVCRLEAPYGKFSECPIEVNNLSPVPLELTFIQLCELEGVIQPSEIPLKKTPALKKFSLDLNEDEENSIQFFCHKKGVSYFQLVGTEGQVLCIPPLTKKGIKIRFEKPSSSQQTVIPQKDELNYVAKYNIILGTSTFVQDVIIIAKFK
ncbi:hypothetical protein RI129_013244 [Pyrocoelia pectoralis]|uniref:CFAP74 fourth Ig-like domain-containing protein n=1 Tax=Pyrocoelia pectoralis TaxID=417401 RepID=A0AAN7V2N2_9COLE